MGQNTSGNIRFGIVGLNRGITFASVGKDCGMELVAVCEIDEKLLEKVGKQYNAATYTNYDKFLEHDMDAVVLANYFHDHGQFAIKALKAGKHVMSEVAACRTLAQGAELVRTVEESGKIYMMAENYAYMAYNQEMRRLYQADEVGELQFAEGEYVHSCSSETLNHIAPGINHWRNHKPATYYCTHALGPIMYITERRPVSVNALCIPFSKNDKEKLHVRTHDIASTIMCKMDNEATVVLNGISLRGTGCWYRVHGTRGLMENLRTGDKYTLRVVHESYDRKPDELAEKIYKPNFPLYEDLATKTGHSGSDFFTTYYFAEAIRTNTQPFLDVYRSVDMTIVGIQAYKSALANGTPFEVPDFRNESERKKHENDNWSPWPEDRGPGQPFPSIKGKITPSAEAIAAAEKIWEQYSNR